MASRVVVCGSVNDHLINRPPPHYHITPSNGLMIPDPNHNTHPINKPMIRFLL